MLLANEGSSPDLNANIGLDPQDYFTIGNKSEGGHSPKGVIHYVGLYSSALTAAEADQNTWVLLSSDDTP